MTSKVQLVRLKNEILAITLVCILFYTFTFPLQVYAKDIPYTFPNLNTFIETVKDGNADLLRGIYISDVLALEIVQQPAGDPTYVSAAESVVTQFDFAARAGNVGLLAHNTQAGSLFSNIKQGDKVLLIYGNGHVEGFVVNDIIRYQALEPLNPYGKFKDLMTQNISSSGDVFSKVYRGKYHLTLQTCIENDGDASWGRLFIIASPIKAADIFRNEKVLSAANPLIRK